MGRVAGRTSYHCRRRTMCLSRYENTGQVAYRKLVVAAADLYAAPLSSDDLDVWPMTLGHAINIQLAAFRYTARAEYHSRAVELAAFAAEQFFADSPLPRASRQTNHYESSTGADTLALALRGNHRSWQSACELAAQNMETENTRVKQLRDKLEHELLARIPSSRVNGDRSQRLPNTTNIIFEFVEGEGILLMMDEFGICASS